MNTGKVTAKKKASLFSTHVVVGAIGLGVHLCVFNFFALVFSMNFYLAQCLGIGVAVLLTFWLHRRWTYRDRFSNPLVKQRSFARYWLVQILALPIPLGVMFVAEFSLGLKGIIAANFFGNFVGPLLATAVRFYLADIWVFSSVRHRP